MAGHYVRIATLLVVCITLMMVFGYGTAMGLSALGVLEAGSMTEPAGPGFDLAVGIANIIPSAFLSVCVTMAFLNRMDLDAAPEPMASSVPAVPTWAETASNQPETPSAVPPEPLPLPDTEVPEAPEVPPEDQGDPEDEKN